jgi:hypothetical protein
LVRKDLLLDIAGITAQLIPTYNQTSRFRLVVSLKHEDTPFYSIGPARHPADRDILEKTGVPVIGIIARNPKFRGDLAVDSLINHFVIDTDKYLLIQKYEKLEVTRKRLTINCTRAAKELAALRKKASTKRSEHLNELSESYQLTHP